MTDPADDDALTWEGDDRLQAPQERAPRLVDDRPETEGGGGAGGGSFALLALGVLGGVAVLESAFWIRSVLLLSIADTVRIGTGTPGEVGAFVANIAGRVLAVAAPLIWFAVVALRIRVPSRRLALLLLGAVLLVPWPVILASSS